MVFIRLSIHSLFLSASSQCIAFIILQCSNVLQWHALENCNAHILVSRLMQYSFHFHCLRKDLEDVSFVHVVCLLSSFSIVLNKKKNQSKNGNYSVGRPKKMDLIFLLFCFGFALKMQRMKTSFCVSRHAHTHTLHTTHTIIKCFYLYCSK